MNTRISILHPSRGRPYKSFETIRQWVDGHPGVEVIVSLDVNDQFLPDYKLAYKDTNAILITNKNRSAVDAVNNAAKVAKGDIYVVVSDDFLPARRWGDEILRDFHGGEFVLKINDGLQRWIITLPILSREYYQKLGYVYHPNFLHMFVDTYFTHEAEVNEVIHKRNDLLFPHRHYSVAKTPKDEVSKKADSTWNQGKNTYLRLVSENYRHLHNWGLRSRESQGHINWVKKALRQYG